LGSVPLVFSYGSWAADVSRAANGGFGVEPPHSGATV
jgi:hypothetical protein